MTELKDVTMRDMLRAALAPNPRMCKCYKLLLGPLDKRHLLRSNGNAETHTPDSCTLYICDKEDE